MSCLIFRKSQEVYCLECQKLALFLFSIPT